MMKGIQISTKITLLILFLSVIAVTAVSVFTYDHVIKINQEKFTTNLAVIADNRAAYFNNHFDKVVTSIKTLQESETLKGGPVAATAPVDGGLDLMDMGSEESTEETYEET